MILATVAVSIEAGHPAGLRHEFLGVATVIGILAVLEHLPTDTPFELGGPASGVGAAEERRQLMPAVITEQHILTAVAVNVGGQDAMNG